MTHKLTKEEQAQTIANYLPGGKVFAAKNVSNTKVRKLLLGFANELFQTDELIALFKKDMPPDATENFISEWEKAVGIPDCCFDGAETDPDMRRLYIIVKLAWMAVQTGADFRSLAAKLGVECTTEGGSVHGCFPFVFPIHFYPTAKAAMHTIVVTFALPAELTFPYTFPIIFGTDILLLIQCIFNRLKPAHVDIIYNNL